MTDFYLENKEALKAEVKETVPYLEKIRRDVGDIGALHTIYLIMDQIFHQPEFIDTITCGDGCSFCCYDDIFVTKPEADLIKNIIDIKGIELDRELIEKQALYPEECSWAETKCALLDENGQCQVYSVRPMVCRTHNSMDDPKFCHKGEYPNKGKGQAHTLQTEGMQLGFHHLMESDKVNMLTLAKYLNES